MSATELMEWVAYQNINGPINPELREDLRNASLIANIWNSRPSYGKRRRKQYKPSDFMPKWGKSESGINPEDLLKNFVRAFGGKVENG